MIGVFIVYEYVIGGAFGSFFGGHWTRGLSISMLRFFRPKLLAGLSVGAAGVYIWNKDNNYVPPEIISPAIPEIHPPGKGEGICL